MDIQESWQKAVNNTKIIRPRVQELHTFSATKLPYVFLTESSLNLGDTVVRYGEIIVDKPAIVLPFNLPQFEGFDFKESFPFSEDTFMNFLLVRGVSFPSFKYNNKTNFLDVYEGRLDNAVDFYLNKLQREENVNTGLITGLEDCWQFSVLIFICTQVAKSAEGDIQKILAEFMRKGRLN